MPIKCSVGLAWPYLLTQKKYNEQGAAHLYALSWYEICNVLYYMHDLTLQSNTWTQNLLKFGVCILILGYCGYLKRPYSLYAFMGMQVITAYKLCLGREHNLSFWRSLWIDTAAARCWRHVINSHERLWETSGTSSCQLGRAETDRSVIGSDLERLRFWL